jgi:ABC-type Fe3+-hydroxamate transport system substrate-binding protein
MLGAAGCVLVGATACGERSEPVGATLSPYPVTVRGAGDRATTLNARPERITPLDEGVANLLIELGAERQLVGLPRRGAPSIWNLTGDELARAVARLRPDLVVASSATDPIDVSRAGRAAHCPVYVVPDESVHDVARALTQLGLLTDHPVAGRRLVRANAGAERDVGTALAREPVVRVFIDTGGFTTVSTRTLVSDLIRVAHGRNVVGPHPEPGVFSLRELRRLNPQVYLTSDRTLTLEYLRTNPKTRGLAAVRTGRLAHISPRLLLVDGDLAARLPTIARLLHPDAYR